MVDPIYLTSAGAERLREELAELKGHGRDALAARLRSAIQMGDLSENADYHKAKEDQAFLEGRIQELEYLLKNATIIEENGHSRETVTVGARVTIQEADYPPETFHVVGAKEADPRNGRISNESPYGTALMGCRVGDEVTVNSPDGPIILRIIDIQ